MICDHRPTKLERYIVRTTIGGVRLEYFNGTSSPAIILLETKIILNSAKSDAAQGARFATTDIKDVFLMTPLLEKEYMRLHKKYFTK